MRRKLTLIDCSPGGAVKRRLNDPKVKKIGKQSDRKAKRASATVERDAYTFAPDDMLAIGIEDAICETCGYYIKDHTWDGETLSCVSE
jgi:hypothetical protein